MSKQRRIGMLERKTTEICDVAETAAGALDSLIAALFGDDVAALEPAEPLAVTVAQLVKRVEALEAKPARKRRAKTTGE